MNTFAKRLRETRNARRLTQGDLARLCGLSQGAIANYEGRSRANPKDIFRIADVLGVRAEWLAKGVLPREPLVHVNPLAEPGISEPSAQGGVYTWPFTTVSPAQIWALEPEERQVIDNTLSALLQGMQSRKDHNE